MHNLLDAVFKDRRCFARDSFYLEIQIQYWTTPKLPNIHKVYILLTHAQKATNHMVSGRRRHASGKGRVAAFMMCMEVLGKSISHNVWILDARIQLPCKIEMLARGILVSVECKFP